MLSDHNRIKLETQIEKSPNIWILNNTLLNNPWIKEEDQNHIPTSLVNTDVKKH